MYCTTTLNQLLPYVIAGETINDQQNTEWRLFIKKRITTMLLTIFVLSTMMGMTAFAWSSSGRQTIYLLPNQIATGVLATRSGNYSYVEARCHAVYPSSREADTYTKIQVSIGPGMSKMYTLNENETHSQIIDLYEGSMGIKDISFDFRGNDPLKSAYADVSYDAK